MFKSKYSTILTVILIIVILAIIIIATLLVIGAVKDLNEESDKKKVFATLQENIDKEENEVIENTINNNIGENILTQPIENTVVNNNTQSQPTNRPTTSFYKNYPVLGYIKIGKINVEYPILSDVSPGALETAVGVMYPNNPKLNQPGNVVIIGHNYRNGKFFSNNKQLVIGDKINITDITGKTLTYKIYEILTIPETDTEYITRDRGNNIEISISTCTDDGSARLVILARAE